jgi:3-hydroxybutyryl-CoA dehydratase
MMQPGQVLPTLTRSVTQEQVRGYAQASGDFNPIHIDPEAGARSRYGRTVAQGMLGLAFVCEMLTGAFGLPWVERGRLKVRFKGPVFPGDSITVQGSVAEVRDVPGGREVRCTVSCRTDKGGEVIAGEASVVLPASGGNR